MSRIENILSLLFVVAFLSSCSLNGQFLHPTKIPASAKQGKMLDQSTGDTLVMHIGEDFQPSFTDTKEVPVPLDYKIESVVFENEVNNLLNGWILTPDSGYNGTTLLFLHGNAGNITTHYHGALPLAKKGFQVFIFDYSGFGFSEGKATRKNTVLDAQAALDYLLHRSDLDVDHLFLYGQSYGGYLATKIAVENQKEIDGLIVEGAFASPDDIAAYTSGLGFIARLFTKEYFTATELISDFEKPVLVIHSTEDETIPHAMGEEIYSHAQEPKEFLEIEKCHICGPLFYKDEIANAIHIMRTDTER